MYACIFHRACQKLKLTIVTVLLLVILNLVCEHLPTLWLLLFLDWLKNVLRYSNFLAILSFDLRILFPSNEHDDWPTFF